MKIKRTIIIAVAAWIVAGPILSTREAQAAIPIRHIVFPVIGNVRYSDDYGAPRSGGRKHEGNDLMGQKMMPLVAAVDGTVRFVAYPEPSYGYMISIEDEDGYRYNYLHVNNDTPRTDDGKGGGINAYAFGMESGWPVVAGQLVGWMGDSGNAERTAPHLHFEIRRPDGSPFSPFQSLRNAKKISKPRTGPAGPNEILPFEQARFGTAITTGQLDHSPEQELIVVPSSRGNPRVRTFHADGTFRSEFFLAPEDFYGGLDVAAGDVTGDGIDEIIVGFGRGHSPEIRVLNSEGSLIRSFDAYATRFLGGVRVDAADLDGDGISEIVTGPGPGGGPEVRVFSADGVMQRGWYAYDQKFRGGVDVAAMTGALEAPGKIVTAPGPGGGPDIHVYDPNGLFMTSFFAYDNEFRGGVRLAAIDQDSQTLQPQIVTVPASRSTGLVNVYSLDGSLAAQTDLFEEWWVSGFDVAAGLNQLYISSASSKRRASVRIVQLSNTPRFDPFETGEDDTFSWDEFF